MTDLEKLKKLTGEEDEELLDILLEDAEAFALSYTNRTRMVEGMEKAVRDLAIIALNRIGTEGESGRSEGGESYSFNDAPKQIYDTLNRYRLARCGGHGTSYNDVQKMFDAWIEEGGDQQSFYAKVILPIMAVSGFFSQKQAGELMESVESAMGSF